MSIGGTAAAPVIGMFRKSFIVLFFALLAGAADAQSIYTPEKSSPERKSILDALRVPVERDLRQPVVFAVETVNVSGTWAFLGGSPQAAGGGRPDYSRTRYADAIKYGAFDNNIFALLKKTSGKWRVVTHQIGCTDVCYAIWWRQFKAPKDLFPYTE